MPRPRTQWLALAFVAVAGISVLLLGLMASGRLHIDSEWPAVAIGGVFIALTVLALRR